MAKEQLNLVDRIWVYCLNENVYVYPIDKWELISYIYGKKNINKETNALYTSRITAGVKCVREKYGINLRFINNKLTFGGNKDGEVVNKFANRCFRRAEGYTLETKKVKERAPLALIEDINFLETTRDMFVMSNYMKVQIKKKSFETV